MNTILKDNTGYMIEADADTMMITRLLHAEVDDDLGRNLVQDHLVLFQPVERFQVAEVDRVHPQPVEVAELGVPSDERLHRRRPGAAASTARGDLRQDWSVIRDPNLVQYVRVCKHTRSWRSLQHYPTRKRAVDPVRSGDHVLFVLHEHV